MLRKEEKTVKKGIDRMLLKEVTQIMPMLKILAKQQELPLQTQQLTSVIYDQSSTGLIFDCDCVFLTEKKLSPTLKKVMQWLGEKGANQEKSVFEGTIIKTSKLSDTVTLKMNLFHFDRYPIQKLSDTPKALKVIFYDPDYDPESNYWRLAPEVLSLNPAVHILINVGKNVEDTSVGKKISEALTSMAIQTFHISEITKPFNELILEDAFFSKLQYARLKNHVNYCKAVYQIINDDLLEREAVIKGKMLLANNRQTQVDANKGGPTTKDISFLKTKIDGKIKQTIKQVDHKIVNFNKEQPDFKTLLKDINSFLGFVENKSSRYLILKISEGALKDKTDKAGTILTNFFESIVIMVNSEIEAVKQDVKTHFKEWKLEAPDLQILPIKKTLPKEIVATTNLAPEKPFEKQITSKGIGSLLMELRTPLFMLMPFMMIFALFGALVGGDDVGLIDESLRFYNNRPCVAITKLPESRGNAFGAFLDDLNSKNKKGLFSKEIEEELTDEPQLATRTEIVESHGRAKSVQKLDYYFDNKKSIAYIYLKSNDHRSFVIETLFDPGYKLLSISSSKRMGFGLGGLINKLKGLSEYRYIILVFLVSLIGWFVTTRKRSMSAELTSSKNREQHKLNSDLKQHVEKTAKQNLQKFRTTITEVLTVNQQATLKTIERTLSASIEAKKQQKITETKLIQKRLTTIKNDKSKLTSLKTDHRKIRSKLEQLETKIKRITRK